MTQTQSLMQIASKPPANPKDALTTLRQLFDASKERMASIAPKHLSAEKMMRIAFNAVSRTPDLLKCTQISVLNSVMQGAMCGLEPGSPLGEAYLVPFRNKKTGMYECQLIIGYRGLISLARRSGEILSIEADVVHAKDRWAFKKTQDGTTFEHEPSEEDDPGLMMRAYAVARLKGTPLPIVIVMPKREIDKIRSRSKATSESSPWATDYDQMAMKTCVRRIAKYLPLTAEFANAIEKDDETEYGKDTAASDLLTLPDEAVAPEPDALDELAKRGKTAASTEPAKNEGDR